MFVEDTTVEQMYNAGYTVGYEWLTKGWNFIHPKGSYTYPNGRTIYGYIPGGPTFFIRAEQHAKEYPALRTKEYNLHKAWRDGYIDGINAYVMKHKLNYPQLVKE
jgi:hypothetical protein